MLFKQLHTTYFFLSKGLWLSSSDLNKNDSPIISSSFGETREVNARSEVSTKEGLTGEITRKFLILQSFLRCEVLLFKVTYFFSRSRLWYQAKIGISFVKCMSRSTECHSCLYHSVTKSPCQQVWYIIAKWLTIWGLFLFGI